MLFVYIRNNVMENNVLKRYGDISCVGNNRWPKLILTRSPKGRKRGGTPKFKWEKEVEIVMKHSD